MAIVAAAIAVAAVTADTHTDGLHHRRHRHSGSCPSAEHEYRLAECTAGVHALVEKHPAAAAATVVAVNAEAIAAFSYLGHEQRVLDLSAAYLPPISQTTLHSQPVHPHES